MWAFEKRHLGRVCFTTTMTDAGKGLNLGQLPSVQTNLLQNHPFIVGFSN